MEKCREIFSRGEEYYKKSGELKEERAILLENWKEVEVLNGDVEKIQEIKKK